MDWAIVPELSRLAWESLPARIQSAGSDVWSPEWTIAHLPGDDWVLAYENQREALERKQRAQGQAQTGVFYTPAWVARYLTRQTLGASLRLVRQAISQCQHTGDGDGIRAMVQQVQAWRILDPACGTGVFLVEALRELAAFYQQVAEMFNEPLLIHPAAYAVRHQLCGIDIDPVSVMITELRLIQLAARLDQATALPASHPTLMVGDTLSGTAVSESERWNFMLGNPPYVSETRGQSRRFQALQSQGAGYYQAKMDLCDAFVMWSIDHLLEGGHLALVLPEYWTQRSSSQVLREQLWEQGQLLEFWRFTGHKLFKNAPGHHPSLLVWQKQASASCGNTRSVSMGIVDDADSLCESALRVAWFTLDALSGKLLYGEPVEVALLQKLANGSPLLRKEEIQQGIVIPQGRLKKADAQRLSESFGESVVENTGVFLLNEAEICELNITDLEQTLLKPYFSPVGFRPFQGFPSCQTNEFIIYGDLKNRKLMDTHPECYAQIRAHLDRYRAINTSAFAPYGLHRARQPQWFEDANKMLCPRQVMVPAFALVPIPAYVNEGFYSIRTHPENPHYLCGILNSRLAWFWFYHHKRKGHRLQIDKDVLAVFPKPPREDTALRADITQLAGQLFHQQNAQVLQNLNQAVYRLYQVEPAEVDFIERAYRSIVGAE